jgi:hypothetical protein
MLFRCRGPRGCGTRGFRGGRRNRLHLSHAGSSVAIGLRDCIVDVVGFSDSKEKGS